MLGNPPTALRFPDCVCPRTKQCSWPLSRSLSRNKATNHHHGAEEYVRFIAVNATPEAFTTREVEEASAVDKELIALREAIKTGRFEKCKAYAPAAAELCVTGQLVPRGTRIVLPKCCFASWFPLICSTSVNKKNGLLRVQFWTS